jgi:hypothetical protein
MHTPHTPDVAKLLLISPAVLQVEEEEEHTFLVCAVHCLTNSWHVAPLNELIYYEGWMSKYFGNERRGSTEMAIKNHNQKK